MPDALPRYSHRGFALDLRHDEAGFAFTISHLGLALHASEPTHRTSHSAERAARQFVDDALTPFAQHTEAYAA